MGTSNIRLLFGLKLKNLRVTKDLSLKELSRLVGLSPSYLNEIERGKKHPKPEKIQKLADALEISYDDLVSQQLDRSQLHYQSLLQSEALQRIPFHLFGISLEDVVSLIPAAADEGSALVSALFDVSRSYDMRVEEFFHTALRCYQEMFDNYFGDIEVAARDFRSEHGFASSKDISLQGLEKVLLNSFKIEVDYDSFSTTEHLSSTRSILLKKEGKERLLINPRFNDSQKCFLVCREIGFRALGLSERGRCSPDIEVESFEQIVNAFKASYFASSVLLGEEEVVEDMRSLFEQERWDSEKLISIVNSYQATIEMFFYRLSEVLPKHFGLNDLHFLRFDCERGANEFELIKQLNMSRLRIPKGVALNEAYCRRWMSIKVLKRLGQMSPETEYDVGVQLSRFYDSEDQFFCISVARPLVQGGDNLSAVTLGFRITDALRKEICFLNDGNIEQEIIGETCERCPLASDACELRAAEPRVFLRDQLRKKQQEELRALLAEES